MAKSFKTVDELIALLDSRGVVVDGNTREAIERESYYAIVNGYKKPFLDLAAMASSSDDVYLPSTEFKWMYDLFLFDRDLRIITFKYLTMAEAVMRTAVAYSFCEAHKEKDAYLDRSNFCDSSSYLVPRAFKGSKKNLYTDNLQDLMRRLNEKLAIKSGTRDFIRHYAKKHGTVPLWVLANDLTFGNIIHFYQLMQENDRRHVCSMIAKVAKRPRKGKFLSERVLLNSANLLNHFRNICAHDERLYCARYNGKGLSEVSVQLVNFLPQHEVDAYVHEIVELYMQYRDRLHNMGFEDLLIEMGFSRVSSDDR